MPLITIGIPTFNSERFISLTIKSILSQTFTDWICLISDDNSTDETVEIVQDLIKNEKRFQLFKQPKRLGPHQNWNYLLAQTNTEYFKLLHADDILYPQAILHSMEAFELNPKAALVSTQRKFTSNPKIKLSLNNKKPGTRISSRNQTLQKYLIFGSNFIKEPTFITFKTNFLKSAGGFDSSWNYLVDMDTYLRVLNHGDHVKIKKRLGEFRISDSSWSADLSKKQLSEEKQFLKHMANGKKIVIFGLTLVTIRSSLRRLYFYLSALRKLHR